MALRKDLNYFKTRLDFIKIFRIHLTTWITVILLSLLVKPFYENVAPFAARVYFDNFVAKQNLVIPKIITAEQYIIGPTQVIDLINGQKVLFASVNNKVNPDVGFFPWVYTYQVLSETSEVLEQRTVSNEFLLPDEQTYIIVYTRNPRASKLRVQPDEINSTLILHNPNSPNFPQPPKIIQRQATINENPDGESYKINIIIRNDDRLDVKQIDVIYLLRNQNGEIVGINKSILTGFLAGTDREIPVADLPKPKKKLDKKPFLEVIVRINYLNPEITKLS